MKALLLLADSNFTHSQFVLSPRVSSSVLMSPFRSASQWSRPGSLLASTWTLWCVWRLETTRSTRPWRSPPTARTTMRRDFSLSRSFSWSFWWLFFSIDFISWVVTKHSIMFSWVGEFKMLTVQVELKCSLRQMEKCILQRQHSLTGCLRFSEDLLRPAKRLSLKWMHLLQPQVHTNERSCSRRTFSVHWGNWKNYSRSSQQREVTMIYSAFSS